MVGSEVAGDWVAGHSNVRPKICGMKWSVSWYHTRLYKKTEYNKQHETTPN